MAEQMQRLTTEAIRRAREVGVEHSLILAAMTGLYISDRRAWLPLVRPTAERILGALGYLAAPAIPVLRVRRVLRHHHSRH